MTNTNAIQTVFMRSPCLLPERLGGTVYIVSITMCHSMPFPIRSVTPPVIVHESSFSVRWTASAEVVDETPYAAFVVAITSPLLSLLWFYRALILPPPPAASKF